MIRAIIALCGIAAAAVAQPATLPVWSVSAAPTLEIGDEANTQTQFNGVSGIVRMPAGEIVVANGRSQELRVFSAQGAYLRTVSRAGRQPGELRGLAGIWRGADTIYVQESSDQLRLHRYTTRGYAGTIALTDVPAGTSVVGRFADGRFVVATLLAGRRDSAGAIVTDSLRFGVADVAAAAPVKWIGTFAGAQQLLIPSRLDPAAPLTVAYSFGHWLAYATTADRLWIGDSDAGTIDVFDSQGARVARHRYPGDRRALDAASVRRLRLILPAEAGNRAERARIEALYSAPLPRLAPRFTRFLPGFDGEIWIEVYHEDPRMPRSYVITSRAGNAIARIDMPADVTPFDIGRDYVLCVRKDAEGLEHIAQYSLKRR